MANEPIASVLAQESLGRLDALFMEGKALLHDLQQLKNQITETDESQVQVEQAHGGNQSKIPELLAR